jgi:Siphovirus Gp157
MPSSIPQAAYANVGLFAVPPPARKGAGALKLEAVASRSAESQAKRKVQQVNDMLEKLEAREAAFGAYIKRLQKRKNAIAARIEKIEDRVLVYMDESGAEVLTGVRCSLRMQTAAASLEVIDESLLPAKFFRLPPPAAKQPDKVAIKAALAADVDLVPASIGVRLTSKVCLIRR